MKLSSLLFWRKPKSIQISERDYELYLKAQAEVTGHSVEELSSDDNMPATALQMGAGKKSGKGFKTVTVQGNLYESNLMDDINQRFKDNELIEKRKN